MYLIDAQVGNGSTPASHKHVEQPVTVVTYTQLVPRQSFEASFRFTTNLEPAEKTSGADVVERPSADDQQVVVDRKILNDSKDIWRMSLNHASFSLKDWRSVGTRRTSRD